MAAAENKAAKERKHRESALAMAALCSMAGSVSPALSGSALAAQYIVSGYLASGNGACLSASASWPLASAQLAGGGSADISAQWRPSSAGVKYQRRKASAQCGGGVAAAAAAQHVNVNLGAAALWLHGVLAMAWRNGSNGLGSGGVTAQLSAA